MLEKIEEIGINKNGIIIFDNPLAFSLEDWYEKSGRRRAIILKKCENDGIIHVVAIAETEKFILQYLLYLIKNTMTMIIIECYKA